LSWLGYKTATVDNFILLASICAVWVILLHCMEDSRRDPPPFR